LEEALQEKFDYVIISGVFNNAIPEGSKFLKELISNSFKSCTIGLAFNFLSTYVNYFDSELAYHDPADIIDFCIKNLTYKVTMHHHYKRCDVAVFVYR
jgi:hypothetical protein